MTVDEAILQLVSEEPFGDQDRLRERLRLLGHQLTQPTLSRHLKRLNVRKVHGVYRFIQRSEGGLPDYTLTPVPPNVVVIRTHPAHAQMLAVVLDAAGIAGVAGTVAGDDTVFVAALDSELGLLCERIHGVLTARAARPR